MKLAKEGNNMTNARFIIITGTIWILEKKVGDIYEYYLGDDFIFGVEKRFTVKDLRMLHKNGYFDQWLNKEV
jgi:hypothetical protein